MTDSKLRLTEIILENIRGFADQVCIPIRPITLIYGANSSGKSTIVRALAWLAHSFSPDNQKITDDRNVVLMKCDEPDIGGADDERTNLGERVPKGPIRIGIGFESGVTKMYGIWGAKGSSALGSPIVASEFGRNCDVGEGKQLARLKGVKTQWAEGDVIHSGNYKALPSQRPPKNLKYEPLRKAYDLLKRIDYLPPNRRTSVSSTTAKLIDAVINDDDLRARINSIVGRTDGREAPLFDLGYTFEVQSGELVLNSPTLGKPVRLEQVGQGVTEVLPVLAQLNNPESRIVLMEQPELHLHPRLQVQLGDVFIHAAKRTSNPLTVISETHSEHLILRFLRRIEETTKNRLPRDFPSLKPSDLSVVFVDSNQQGAARVSVLRIDDDGEFIDRWPSGFFEERAKELFACS